MSSITPTLPAAAIDPVKTYPKALSAPPSEAPHPAEHHSAPALSAAAVGYVEGLMGFAPAQTMAYIMLKTGVPMPENLGQDFDKSA